MRRENVYLIDLGTGTGRNLLPLSIGLISSYARSMVDIERSYKFDLCFLRDQMEEMISGFDRPAVVGLACYVWNFRATMAVARKIRQRYPDTLIVIGGYSVPKRPERISTFFKEHPYIDILVHGEGEITFAEILIRRLVDKDWSAVQGITFQSPDLPGGFLSTSQRERIDNLDILPSPFLNGVFDQIMARHSASVTGAVWETNRGCPFSCSFCDWGNADVNKVKLFGFDRLKEEIKWIGRNNIFYIYGADANFGIFLERDYEIAGMIADQCKEIHYPGYLMINWTKNSHERVVNIADRLTGGGVVTTVTMAIQSYNQPTLEAIKRKNIKSEVLLDLKKAFHDRNLPTYTEIILGLPMETRETFRDGLEQVMTTRLDDNFVVYLCTLLENTEMDDPAYRSRYELESRVCAIGMSRRKFVDDVDDREKEEFVVGTSTLPISHWRESYMLGYMGTALFNHRVAFFIMQFINYSFGTKHTDYILYLLREVENSPAQFPRLYAAVSHVMSQSQMVLDGICSMSGPVGMEDISLTPHEAALAIMLYDLDALYDDLLRLTQRFCVEQGFNLSALVLREVLLYQQIRIPALDSKAQSTVSFQTNIPSFFDVLVRGGTPIGANLSKEGRSD